MEERERDEWDDDWVWCRDCGGRGCEWCDWKGGWYVELLAE